MDVGSTRFRFLSLPFVLTAAAGACGEAKSTAGGHDASGNGGVMNGAAGGGRSSTGGNGGRGSGGDSGSAGTGGTAGASAGDGASSGGEQSGGSSGSAGDSAGVAGESGGSGVGGEAGAGGSGGGPSANPSCVDLPLTCGSDGASDCCSSLIVSGGTFQRNNGPGANWQATVSDFRLDRYEITVGRFRKFVAGYPGNQPVASSGRNPNDSSDPGWESTWNSAEYLPPDQAALTTAVQCSSTYQTWTGGDDNRPMNCITWYEAYAFCIWDGGRLPTNAESNYAAAGGSEQRYYPWSVPRTNTTIDSTYAVYGFNDREGPTAVGSRSPKGDGRWGQADLAGNLVEWVRDGNDGPTVTYPSPCVNCADLTGSLYRTSRGGGFLDADTAITTFSTPGGTAPSTRYTNYGARCARSAE